MPTSCHPIIEPCNHGRFKLECACGYRVHTRFLSILDAEKHWASHADQMLSS